MHTEDYTPKRYALSYIWRNYERGRGHTEENIHKRHYSMLGGEYRQRSVNTEATKDNIFERRERNS